MENKTDIKARPPSSKKKFRSPVGGKRPHKTSVFPRFRINLKEPDKQVQKAKQKTDKAGSKHRFRLGGDSSDPLNLNSLIDRDPSEVTPQCSPCAKESSPRVFVQATCKDVTDPLNLKCDVYQDLKGIVVATPVKKKRKRKRNDSNCYEEDRENEGKGEDGKKKGMKDILSPKVKKKKQVRHKGKDEKDEKGKENQARKNEEKLPKTAKATPVEKEKEAEVVEELEQKIEKTNKKEEKTNEKEVKTNEKEVKEEKKLDESESKDTTATKSTNEYPKPQTFTKFPSKGAPSKQKSKKTFLYGNYNRYYGYRNPNSLEDSRVKFFQPEWFKDKDVLDIGCNIGNVTLQVAREFGPRRVLGIDIDSVLIRTANKYLRCCIQEQVSTKSSMSADFPMSFALCRGPISSSGCPTQEDGNFPYNVEFKEVSFTLLYSTLPYPTLPYPTLPYPTLPYPTLPYPTLPYPTLPYPTLPYPTLLYSTLLYSTLQYSTLQYSTLLYSTLLHHSTPFYLPYTLLPRPPLSVIYVIV